MQGKRFGPALETKQMVLFRAVDIGAELYAMSATITRAKMLAGQGNTKAMDVADVFCRESRDRIDASFRALYGRHDGKLYRLAQSVMKGEHAWLEQGIVDDVEIAAKTVPVPRAATREPAGIA